MEFLYQQEASSLATRNFYVAGGTYLAVAAIAYLAMTKANIPPLMLGAVVLIGLAVGTVFLKGGLKLQNNPGSWRVVANAQEGLVWESPDESIDPSFKYDLSALDSSITYSPRNKTNGSIEYVVKLKSGEYQKISQSTGADIDHLFAVLEQLGIPNTRRVRD